VIYPKLLASALSAAYGTCILARVVPLLWVPCPECRGQPRITRCHTCGDTGRVAVFA
jgi:predicted RNA-binding Zn-ribbon protein involved in translation (DUF1610 family)